MTWIEKTNQWVKKLNPLINLVVALLGIILGIVNIVWNLNLNKNITKIETSIVGGNILKDNNCTNCGTGYSIGDAKQ